MKRRLFLLAMFVLIFGIDDAVLIGLAMAAASAAAQQAQQGQGGGGGSGGGGGGGMVGMMGQLPIGQLLGGGDKGGAPAPAPAGNKGASPKFEPSASKFKVEAPMLPPLPQNPSAERLRKLGMLGNY